MEHLAGTERPACGLTQTDLSGVVDARRSEIDRHLQRNARRRRRARVLKDITLAIFVSATALGILEIFVHSAMR